MITDDTSHNKGKYVVLDLHKNPLLGGILSLTQNYAEQYFSK